MDFAIGINTVVLAISALISTMTPIMLSILNRNQLTTARQVAANVEAVRTNLGQATEKIATNVASMQSKMQAREVTVDQQLQDIQSAVNAEGSAIIARLSFMHAEILKLTTTKLPIEP
jgi:hypothetical protein